MRTIVTVTFVALMLIVVSTAFALGQEDMAREPGLAHDGAFEAEAPVLHVPSVSILETFDAPANRPAGIGWDGTSLWVVSDTTKMIYKLEAGTMAVLDSFPTPAETFAFGLDHSGSELWGDTDELETIYRADEATGIVSDSFTSPLESPNGVAWDGAEVWHSGFRDDLTLMDSTNGSTIRTIPAPGDQVPRGLEWVDETLWVVDVNLRADDAIYQIDPADGAVLRHVKLAGATFPYGIAFDGEFFWVTDLTKAKIYKVDFIRVHVDGFESGDTSAWSATVQ